ncbi:5'-nucleotidase C-terminal domain-containing protein [Pontimicrobium sp. SW4]|uniref:5'-nucleotidase C-terminal domain-containing protein n=1 Tax=Pontimicrobium sp. SW4 TaxID=3153519 RepID=A0AAU7BNV7_9FLAO
MTNRYFLSLIVLILLVSCKQEVHLTKIEGKRIEINDSLSGNKDIEAFIKPFREHVNSDLDSVLAYSLDTYSKTDGELNTAIGNFMADAVKEMANPIFKARTGNDIDIVMLNHGGIRSILSKGDITSRTAYQIMPFENSVVVTDLKGTSVKEMISYLQKAKRAHPISGMSIKLNRDFELLDAKIKGEAIDDNKTYYVATNDYLYNGGDNMSFFRQGDSLYKLDYKIRNILIDYFKKVDTLNLSADNRFIKTK